MVNRKDLQDSDLNLDHLRKEFDRVLLSSKAKELGVDPSEVVTTVHGGKRVVTTKAKVAQRVEKQRKVINRQKKIQESAKQREAESTDERTTSKRAIRDGDASIVGEFEARLEDCLRLVALLGKAGRMSVLEERDTKISIKSAADNALRFAQEVQRIEETIEQKKGADPLLSKLDAVARTVHAAKMRGDKETAARLISENRDALSQYESRRRVLDPDIQAALHSRYKLLCQQRRLMRIQLQLYAEWGRLLRGSAAELTLAADQRRRIDSALKSLRAELSKAQQVEAEGSAKGKTSDKDIRAQNQALDKDIHRLSEAIRVTSEQAARLDRLIEEFQSSGKPAHRMAVRERAEE